MTDEFMHGVFAIAASVCARKPQSAMPNHAARCAPSGRAQNPLVTASDPLLERAQ